MNRPDAHPKVQPSDGGEPKSQFEQTMYQRSLFLSMAMNMTWQLAIVVIIPIVGGYKLDEHLNSSPLWTLIGLLVAVLGVMAVMVRIVRQAALKVDQTPGVKK